MADPSTPSPPPAGGALVVEIQQDAPIPLDVAFTCEPGHVLAIFGPSGSGKTTILRTIAGLYRPSRARIGCGGATWTDTASGVHAPTRERRVGMVFQDYALFPHMTARGNVAAALTDRPTAVRTDEATRWLAAVHLNGFEHRRPAELSGGQRQRVALARALARAPQVLLLDEPFAAIDRATRRQLHDELDEQRRRAGIPVILVTHDYQDVARLATHVLLLDGGRVVSRGSVEEIARHPDVDWPA